MNNAEIINAISSALKSHGVGFRVLSDSVVRFDTMDSRINLATLNEDGSMSITVDGDLLDEWTPTRVSAESASKRVVCAALTL